MPILNYTTSIDAGKTAAEITAMLAKHGATTVASFYEDGELSGIAFAIATPSGQRDYRLPANVPGVATVLGKVRDARARKPGQAARTAWRILKDWVEAQLAIIEAGMVPLDEVMLPYMLVKPGRTVAMEYRDGNALAIEARS